ncbi:MAG: DNA polymerase I [Planctomycetota bacterium]
MSSSRPTLYLIDGYAQFFRAYHAIRTPMTSPVTGEPTNMSFGFVGMLLKLLRGQEASMQAVGGPPTYLAMALDVSGDRGTFRSELYPEYKANRDAPPDDLFPQIERCLTLLETLGVPSCGAAGFEADDAIATIVRALEKSRPELLIRIVSKDKDLKQLLEPGRVELYDVHTDKLIDADSLRDESGIGPEQVVDMLTLMGDTVDNVPGVPGIGPKTAAQLIAELGDLEAVIAEVSDNDKPKKDWVIKGKRRENILAAKDALPLSRELVTLRDDAPVELDLDAAAVASMRPDLLEPVLRELGFNRLKDEARELAGGSIEAVPSSGAAAMSKDDGGFGGLFDQVEQSTAPTASGDYRIVRTEKELRSLVQRLRKANVVALDTETTSIKAMRADLCGLSFAVKPGEAWYVPVRSPEEPGSHLDEASVLEALRPIIEDAGIPKVGHNLKYDLLVLRRAGIEMRGLTNPRSCDTMVASYLLDASRSSHSLDALSLAMLGRANVSIKELIGSGKKQKTFDQVPLEQAGPYAAEDADVSLQLAERMRPRLESDGLEGLAGEVEMPLVEVLAELEWNGIVVERDELDRQRERLEKEIAALRERIEDEAYSKLGRGFDPDSPKQLAGVLFNKAEDEDPGFGIKPLKRGKTGPSTDAEVLEKLSHDASIETPIPGLVLDYRQLTKLVNTYLSSLVDDIDPDTGRIHASFNQTVAATGRLSSSDPNLQNIPIRTDVGREIRRAFVAPEGRVLISADYSQIELRILAHLSQDPALIEAFQDDQDIHAAVAAQIHGVAVGDVTREQRSGAKMVNFGIVYGITPFGLARRLGVSNTEATGIIDGYKRKFAGITTFLQECVEQAQRNGYVETMLKRRRPIADIDSNNPGRRSLAERMAINSVVQGSAADLIKLAMRDLHRRLSPSARHWRGGADAEIAGVRMLLQIHDELVFEADEDAAERASALIVDRMASAMELDVPLKVDASVSSNWFDGH